MGHRVFGGFMVSMFGSWSPSGECAAFSQLKWFSACHDRGGIAVRRPNRVFVKVLLSDLISTSLGVSLL